MRKKSIAEFISFVTAFECITNSKVITSIEMYVLFDTYWHTYDFEDALDIAVQIYHSGSGELCDHSHGYMVRIGDSNQTLIFKTTCEHFKVKYAIIGDTLIVCKEENARQFERWNCGHCR